MKLAVVAPSPVPFVFGGAERFWLDLVRALNELTPHEVELVKLPFPERDFWEVVDGYRRFFALDLSAFDGIISTKYPAWMVQHPSHRVYMQHKLRGLYDTYPRHLSCAWPKDKALAELGRLVAEPNPTPAQARELFEALEFYRNHPLAPAWFTFPGPVARQVVHFLDRMALRPEAILRYAAISQTVADRPGYFPKGVKVHVVHHPSGLRIEPLPFPKAPILLTASRLEGPKRVDLILRAFARLSVPEARLWIAGTGPQEEALRALAADDPRILFLGRLSDAELAQAYACAQGIVFLPAQEDLGLVALEAQLAARPVITCSDAGGVTELIRHQETGWVVEPNEEAVACAMRELLADPKRAQRFGEAGRARAAQVRWDAVIKALGLTPQPRRQSHKPPRPILVLAPFTLRPPRAGGANRIFYLYRAWSKRFPVHVVCLGAGGRWHFPPALTIEEIPMTREFEREASAWSARLKVSSADIALLSGMAKLPAYVARVGELAPSAALLVLSHPYCLPALPAGGLPPLVYDAHNVEQDLKAAMWQVAQAESSAQNEALTLVQTAEAEALRRAVAVLTVCQEEAERLRRLYQARGDLVWVEAPNGVALTRRLFLTVEEKRALRRRLGIDGPLAVFVGSWHEPNVVALDTLLALAREFPKVNFALAGSLSAHPKLRQVPSNLAVLGTLAEAELAVLLAAADIGLNPVTLGAGTNLKVLDYAASGLAILSTPFGVRGLGLQHGQEAWLSEPLGFDLAFGQLLADVQLRERLALAARRVAERFDWENIGARSLAALEQSEVLG